MTDELCAKCGHPRAEHSINGACYGLCGEFVAPHPAPDATDDGCPKPPPGYQQTWAACSAPLKNGVCSACGRANPAPDATNWKALCGAAEEERDIARADATRAVGHLLSYEEMKEECPGTIECAVGYYRQKQELTAAQAENRQLRAELAQCRKAAEVTEISHDGLMDEVEKLRRALDAAAMYARARSECYGSSPMGTYAEGHKDASSILLAQIEAIIATLSPPPLSPEKP